METPIKTAENSSTTPLPQKSVNSVETNEISDTPASDYKAGYEYLDHPADVIIHSWGEDIEEAFEWAVSGLTGYMVGIEQIEEKDEITITAEGHDLKSLLFNFLDAFLSQFNINDFATAACEVEELVLGDPTQKKLYSIKAFGFGEKFDPKRHIPGTEIKAITYSAMNIVEKPDRSDVYLVVDI